MTWTCSGCGNEVTDAVETCERCGAARGPVPVATPAEHPAGVRDLRTESHVRAIAWWLGADGAFIGSIAFLVLLQLILDGELWSGMSNVALLAGMGAGYYLLGHYLGRFVNAARIVAGVVELAGFVGNFALYVMLVSWLGQHGLGESVSEDLVMLLALGLTIGRVVLKVLRASVLLYRAGRLCTPEYRALVRATPEVAPSILASAFFWVPWIGIALTLVLLYLTVS